MRFTRGRKGSAEHLRLLVQSPTFIAAIVTVAFTPLTGRVYADRRDPALDEVSQGGGGRLPILVPLTRRDEWPGGSQSLPYGDNVSPVQLVQAARNLAAVQPAMSEFISRGYLRRPDLDYAQARRGYAVAVLGFQKPGVPTTEQQACIEVVTRSLTLDGIDCPATQVFGGVLRDSAGFVVPGDPAVDRPLIVVPVSATEPAAALPDPIDENFVFKYSAREFLADAPHFQSNMSPGALALYNAEARTVLNGEIEGLLFGLPGGGGLMIFGGIVGMAFAANQFWINPPDTCGCGHHAVEAPADRLATRPPAGGGTSTGPIFAEGRVLDVQGRLVKDLGGLPLGSGLNRVRWDETDASGRRAPAGVYFVSIRRLSTGRPIEQITRRVIIAR